MEDFKRVMDGTFYFDPEDKIYRDHFPGNPIVPGSLIVNAFMAACKKEGINIINCGIRNFRFRVFIGPGEYGYKMAFTPGMVKCTLYAGSQKVATGTVVI